MPRLTPNSHDNEDEATNKDGDGVISIYLYQLRKHIWLRERYSCAIMIS